MLLICLLWKLSHCIVSYLAAFAVFFSDYFIFSNEASLVLITLKFEMLYQFVIQEIKEILSN